MLTLILDTTQLKKKFLNYINDYKYNLKEN